MKKMKKCLFDFWNRYKVGTDMEQIWNRREKNVNILKINDLLNFGTGTDNFAYIGRILLPFIPLLLLIIYIFYSFFYNICSILFHIPLFRYTSAEQNGTDIWNTSERR
jgi:hypothetical protein